MPLSQIIQPALALHRACTLLHSRSQSANGSFRLYRACIQLAQKTSVAKLPFCTALSGFASVKRSFWMKNGSRGLAGEGPFWLWDGLSCRLGGTSGCHEYMGIGEKCVHKYLNVVFQSRVMFGIAKNGKMWVSLR